jgi:hypothetical protein
MHRSKNWGLYQNSLTLTHAACAPTGTSITKMHGGPMGYRGRASARTAPRMSQCLRSLVLFHFYRALGPLVPV